MKTATNSQRLGLQYPALLIHGLFSGAHTWKKSIERLVNHFNLEYGGDINDEKAVTADFYTINFSKNYDLSYRQQAEELQSAIKIMKKLNGTNKVILIGHSMGGLAARAYIQLLDSKDVYLLITLGTPHYGSPLALLRDTSEQKARNAFQFIQKKLLKLQNKEESTLTAKTGFLGLLQKIKRFLVKTVTEGEQGLLDFLDSEAFLELRPGSDALEELNRMQLPDKLRYVCIIGNLTLDPLIYRTDLGKKRRAFRSYWKNLTRTVIRKYSSSYFDDPYKTFTDYITSIINFNFDKSEVFDFDVVVPVLSQQLHHFKKPPVKYCKIMVASAHMTLTNQADKIYQALAVGEAF